MANRVASLKENTQSVNNINELFLLLTSGHQNNKPWWKIAAKYFESHNFTEHQIDSYNTFMREKLANIITNYEIDYKKTGKSYIISFNNVYIKKPDYIEPNGLVQKLYPNDCRIRDLSYMCKIYADVYRYQIDDDGKILETKTFLEVFLGAMPCMVLSDYCNLHNKDDHGLIKKNECPRDPGGYFIINGSEKVLMSSDRMGHNEIFVFKSKDKETIKLPVAGSEKNRSLPCDWSAEVRSYTEQYEPNITTTYLKLSHTQLDKGEDARLYIEIPGLKAPVPWPILFMALGVCDKKDMITYVCSETDAEMIALLQPSLECPEITDQTKAFKYLSTYVLGTQKDNREIQLKRILYDKLFQNVGNFFMKRYYLGHMTYQLLATVIGRRHEDDRDHYGRKRVETAGSLINNLFKSIWKRVLRETKNHLEKKRTDDLAQILFGKFTNYIKPPFATGNWTATKITKACKTGISQLLNRHNFISTLSNLRRVITPNDKNSRIIKPRHLHGSQWLYMCPAETPEGQATGLIKNLAMLTIISLGTDEEPVLDWLRLTPELIQLINPEESPVILHNKNKVFVNGSWVGVTTEPGLLVQKLRNLRRNEKLSFDTSISILKDTVRILTDEGRVLVPFLIVENGQLKPLPCNDFSWNDLITNQVVEYLDPNELETLFHSEFPWKLEPKHTHSVIHPCFLLGVAASTAPFPDHNQSPRNIYQCLWVEEPVLMANGTHKKIGEIKIGDSITTFDPISFRTTVTRVINAFSKNTTKIIVKLTTISGRTITVTNDHLMMTHRGWIEAGALKETDAVAISLKNINCLPSKTGTIIDILEFNSLLQKKSLSAVNNIKSLRDKQLLPLTFSNENILIICRLLGAALGNNYKGFQYSSGDIYFNFPDEESVEEFVQDVNIVYGEKPDVLRHYKVLLSNSLATLLICLADKLDILIKEKSLNREILAGFIGATTSISRFYMNKVSEHFLLINKGFLQEGIVCNFTSSHFIIPDHTHIGCYYNASKLISNGLQSEYDRIADKSVQLKFTVGTIFVPISSIKVVPNVVIADITTEAETHSFIAGDNFCVHNSSMCKQALGIYAGNFMHRYETNAHILCYPQKPLVNTKTMQLLGMEDLPSGQNLIVAVMCGAYNQEDSVIINQRSIDNGALRSICYTTYSESNYRKGNNLDEIKKPEKSCVREARIKGYAKLDSDGVSKENTPLSKRDIVVAKVNSTPDMVKDSSVVIKSNGLEEDSVTEVESETAGVNKYIVTHGAAIIDRSLLTLNEDSFRTNKIRTRQMRVPQIGDKVASRSAQKGIIGMITKPENMPFAKKTGIIPDIIMNPNAIPSRMTIAQPLEALLGKACALTGTYGDCTPFEPEFSTLPIEDQLKLYGFQEYGDEVMINGETGEEMECQLFMGPTYYQRLKHMVDDKIHSRDQDGPRETLTRQPVEGRKRGGGFRMGEMETWCGISHGASMFLIDRLVNNSDGYEMYVCDYCGNPAIATLKTSQFECKHCSQNTKISKIRIPYAFKLIMQELQATGMGIWFKVDTNNVMLPALTPSH